MIPAGNIAFSSNASESMAISSGWRVRKSLRAGFMRASIQEAPVLSIAASVRLFDTLLQGARGVCSPANPRRAVALARQSYHYGASDRSRLGSAIRGDPRRRAPVGDMTERLQSQCSERDLTRSPDPLLGDIMTPTKTITRTLLATSASAFGLIAFSGMASAQDGVATPPETAVETDATPSQAGIIVTARRREETLIDVPVPVTVFGAEQLRNLGATDIVDVAELTPGFSMQDNSRQNEQPFIRGISVGSFFPDAQKASFFHDGVFVSGTSRTLNQDDIERIEVVKGPQAVYFGRQTFAGAVNYVTRKPTFDFRAHGRIEAAENNDFEVTAGVSGPLIDDVLAFRVFGQYGTDDGAFENTLDGIRLQQEETKGGSASLMLQPSSTVSFTARAQYVEFDDSQAAAIVLGSNLNTCRPNAGGTNQAICGELPIPRDISLNLTAPEFEGGRRTVTQERYSLIGSIEFGGGYELSTLTAYNKEDRINSGDGDGLPQNTSFGRFTFTSEYEDFTQQLVLTSPQSDRFRWLLGGIYFELDRVEFQPDLPLRQPKRPHQCDELRGVRIRGI